jgi:hypothetical protein
MGQMLSDCCSRGATSLFSSHSTSNAKPRNAPLSRSIRDNDGTVDYRNIFSADDKKRIRRTWSRLHVKSPNRDDIDAARGSRVFERIFQQVPDARQFFQNIGEMKAGVGLAANSLFRHHAIRFITAVDMVVCNLDALDIVVIPTLLQLGRRHVTLKSFSTRYVHAFEEAMDYVWRRDLGLWIYKGRTREAWRKLFNFIASLVIEGYTSTPLK